MSFVAEISFADAGPELRQLYAKIESAIGFLPHYYQALGRAPAAISAQLALNDAVVNTGILPGVVKEQIGIVVSGINSSMYCIAVHMELLSRMGIERTLGRKLAVDYAGAPVAENVKALFRFADKLTRRPGEVEAADVEAVRRAGWGDDAIIETVLTAAYFNFINRVSFGLGLVPDF